MDEEEATPFPDATGQDRRSWLRAGGTVRKELLRRIAEGRTCGAATTEGRPCLAAQDTPGGFCVRHKAVAAQHSYCPPEGIGRNVQGGAHASTASLAWRLYGRYLPPEQQAHFTELAAQPLHTLDDLIIHTRLRLLLHIQRHNEGRTTLAEYEKACRDVGAEIRQLAEANVRIRTAQAELAKLEPSSKPDLWNPAEPDADDAEEADEEVF